MTPDQIQLATLVVTGFATSALSFFGAVRRAILSSVADVSRVSSDMSGYVSFPSSTGPPAPCLAGA